MCLRDLLGQKFCERGSNQSKCNFGKLGSCVDASPLLEDKPRPPKPDSLVQFLPLHHAFHRALDFDKVSELHFLL